MQHANPPWGLPPVPRATRLATANWRWRIPWRKRPETSRCAVPESNLVVFHQRMINEPAAHAARRRTAVVQYNGVSYTRDLSLCRRALTECQVGGAYLGGLAELSEEAGCSRSTASRFFSGRNVSIEVTLRLLKGLKLSFEAVHTLRVASNDEHH